MAATASAGAPAYKGGLGAELPAGVQGADPQWGSGESPSEADGSILSTHFCAVLELVVVADLTEAIRQRRTFGRPTAAILSVND